MAEGEIDDRLTKLRVLQLDETPRARAIEQRWLYYTNRQNDHCEVDWEGYKREPGLSYTEQRQRAFGYVAATPESIPFGHRRPTCPTMICGQVVDTYTSLLLGEGRQPAVRVVGDDDSTELLEALLEASESWDSLAEARTIAGATGAAAVVPEVIDGEPCVRVLRPDRLYVEWADRRDWIPKVVIEQKLVAVEHLDEQTGRVGTVQVWRTRAWDEEYAYVFQDIAHRGDVPDDERDQGREDDIELAQPPIRHGAGRCPVIWAPNTKDSESPIGEPDCAPVYEQIDQLDRLQSMIVRGAKANVDPTLVIKDRWSMLARWPTRSKGYGQKIEVSEVGDASLLEIDGKSIEMAWLTFYKVWRQVDLRTGVITIDAENAGSYQSGVALQMLWRTQNTRAGLRRNPLGKVIVQLCEVWLSLVRFHGTKLDGDEGEGIALPPRENETEADKTDLVKHEPGPGGAVTLNWPRFHEATPSDLDVTARALSMATGGKPVLSQESAVAHMVNLAQTDTDVATELARINGETDARIAAFDQAMAPDVEGLAVGELLDSGAEPQAKDVQELALNGAQTKALFDAIARVNVDLSPTAVRIGIRNAFPAIDEAEAERMVSEQERFADEARDANESAVAPPSAATPVQRPVEEEKSGKMEMPSEEGDGEEEAE